MTQVIYVSLFLLSCVGIVCGFTNLDFFNAITDHVNDIKIDYDGPSCERLDDSDNIRNDRTLCDGIIDIPGTPTDEFDPDFLLKEIGFAPYDSADQCESHTSYDVDNSLRVVSKYCHYKQYLTNGLQDIDSVEDQANDKDVDSFHVHFHYHGSHYHHSHNSYHYHYNHRHHHHCHERNYVKCSCKGIECSCCLGRTFRFNHCAYRTTFYMEACLVIKYKGQKKCPATITTTVAPPTTTEKTTARTTTEKTTARPTTTEKKTTVAPPTTTTIPTPPPNEEYPNMNDESLTGQESLYDITFKVNGHRVYERSVTTDHLKPLCYKFRARKGEINACMEFYSVKDGRVCIRLTGTWTIGKRGTKLSLNVGCMKLPRYRKADLLDILTNGMYWEE
ncbi:hypothetical protein ACF0H5_012701 [Mactra antiquata]